MSKIVSYKDLVVWQRAMNVVALTYDLVKKYPVSEKYILARETCRSAISIPSNIAEGKCRGSGKDFARFLQMAFASGAELETQIEIALRTKIISKVDCRDLINDLEEVMKMLNVLIRKLKANNY